MMDLHISDPVKGIIACQFKIRNLHITAVHGKIISSGADILHGDLLTVPQRLLRMWEEYMLQRKLLTSAEILRCLDQGIFHLQIVRIPYTGSRHLCPGTILCHHIFAVPQRIFPLEHTVL